jgi:hypothetical protein
MTNYSCQEEYNEAMEAEAQHEAEMEAMEAEAEQAEAEAEQDTWCCGSPPDESGLCPACREHIN